MEQVGRNSHGPGHGPTPATMVSWPSSHSNRFRLTGCPGASSLTSTSTQPGGSNQPLNQPTARTTTGNRNHSDIHNQDTTMHKHGHKTNTLTCIRPNNRTPERRALQYRSASHRDGQDEAMQQLPIPARQTTAPTAVKQQTGVTPVTQNLSVANKAVATPQPQRQGPNPTPRTALVKPPTHTT